MRSPDGEAHSFHDSSSDTVAKIGFFGWNARPATGFRWPLKVLLRVKFCTAGGSNSRLANGLGGTPRGTCPGTRLLVIRFVFEPEGADSLLLAMFLIVVSRVCVLDFSRSR